MRGELGLGDRTGARHVEGGDDGDAVADRALDGGGFVVTRTGWGLSRRLDSLDQVRRLLRLMAGGQGGAQ